MGIYQDDGSQGVLGVDQDPRPQATGFAGIQGGTQVSVRPNALQIGARTAPTPGVQRGAMQIGVRPGQGAPQQAQKMYMGEYDNGYGGMFGEQVQEGRGLTVDALGMHRSAATGQQPSAAQILGQQGIDQAARSQQSLAASARGAGALAMAQQQAGYNTAAMQQQAAAQMAALRAQEMESARNSYLQGAMGMRGQDMERLGLAQQRATADADLQERNREGASAHAARAGGIGVQWGQLGYGISKSDYAGDVAQQDARYNDMQDYQNQVLGKAQRDAAARGKIFRGALERGMDFMGTATGGGGATKSGSEEGDRAAAATDTGGGDDDSKKG